MEKLLTLKKDLVYMEKASLKDEYAELNICINSFDTYGMLPTDAWEFAEKYGLVQNDRLIIPQGSILIEKEPWQGAMQYTFKTPNNIEVIVDLNFYGYENEYLG